MSATRIPTEQDAVQILHDALGKTVRSIQRFPTGLANYIYDVETNDGQKIVVRLGHPDNKPLFEAACIETIHSYVLSGLSVRDGTSFNKDAPILVDPAQVETHMKILE